MRVYVKSFGSGMEVKNNGVEFAVYDTDDTFLGDIILSKSGVTWCHGRTRPENGAFMKWRKFIDTMQKSD